MAKTWPLILVLLILTVFAVIMLAAGIKTYSQRLYETDESFQNLFTGFAPYARNYENITDDTTLAYVDIFWSELEPEDGVYDFDGIEKIFHLNELKDRGIHIVLRFITDYPGHEKHIDIPDWLFEKTGGAGTFYDCSYGKGFSPDYSNSDFISYHMRAVEALGEHFGNDTFISYIELGSIGHWGEWHVNTSAGIGKLPSSEVLEQYVTPWVESFPNAKILMRRPFSFAKKNNAGVYNDMTGDADSTYEWFNWINNGGEYSQNGDKNGLVPMPGVWNTAPVGGEFTSGIPESTLFGDSLDQTLELVKESHMSFIGPKIPKDRSGSGYGMLLGTIGYRFSIGEVKLTELFGKCFLSFDINNKGSAPMYWDMPLCIYVCNGDLMTEYVFESDVRLSQLGCGSKKKISMVCDVKDLVSKIENENWSVWIGIVDTMTGSDAVRFANDAPVNNGRMLICGTR